MQNHGFEKAEVFQNVEIIEYVPNSIVIKTIVKKTTDRISVIPFDLGETATEKIIPHATLIQITHGRAEIIINGKSNLLNTGQSVIIPAYASNIIRAKERFKMISTIIKEK
jgi:mannose-6-phosphate isomerase class I